MRPPWSPNLYMERERERRKAIVRKSSHTCPSDLATTGSSDLAETFQASCLRASETECPQGPWATRSSPMDANKSHIRSSTDMKSQELGRYTTHFQWLGSPSSCRKKRRHYRSFQRNGVIISVYDFVYVLAEEGKRLVAYLEDMYEDSKSNKMVVVRWYHKIDEVGLVLPHHYNDREVFFSLCLQDLSIECIDGLAAILSPQHFERFLKVATHTKLEPFVCREHFENDQVLPFDVTQVKGYWKQDILRYIHMSTPPKEYGFSFQQFCTDLMLEENTDAVEILPPRKRQCRERKESISACEDAHNLVASAIDFKGGIATRRTGEISPTKKIVKEKSPQYYEVGSRIEVLSQDSGIRGCWFRALVTKKHKDKVKVRYEDIQDAANEANSLEEWISASKVASPDPLGLRISGRLVVRPSPLPETKGRVTWAFDVGTVVDVWRHDAWWEGIVVQKELNDRFRVFFPGERLDSFFSREELRHSREWFRNGWTQIKERRALVAPILGSLDAKQVIGKPCHVNSTQATNFLTEPLSGDESGLKDSCRNSEGFKDGNINDLSKDNLLAQLKWKSSTKRRRCDRIYVQKVHPGNTAVHEGAARGHFLFSRARERFMTPPSLKLDQENCKIGRNSLFISSVTNLVMSR